MAMIVEFYCIFGERSWRATCHDHARTHQITRTAPDCLVRPTIHRISRSPRSRLAAPPVAVAAERLGIPDLTVDLLHQRQPAATGQPPGQHHGPRSRRASRRVGRMRANPERETLEWRVRRL